MTVKQLEAAEEQARQAWEDLKSQYSSELFERKREAERLIRKELDEKYGTSLDDVATAYHKANTELIEKREASALSGEGGLYPVGTKMVWWIPAWDRWERSDSKNYGVYKPSNKLGVYEAVTRETVHPINTASYSRTDIGSFVVRLLNKDGSLSKRYEVLQTWLGPSRWQPEGTDYNEVVKRHRREKAK